MQQHSLFFGAGHNYLNGVSDETVAAGRSIPWWPESRNKSPQNPDAKIIFF